MQEYSISKKNIFEHLWILSIGIIIFIVGVIYGKYRLGDENIVLILIISISVVLLLTIPTLVLHIQYYLKNKDTQLKIDFNRRLIFLKQKDTNLEFTFDDIKYMRKVKELEYARRGTYFLPWGLFNHTVIHLNDGSKIVITSYLVIDFDLPIDENKKELIQVYYPFIV